MRGLENYQHNINRNTLNTGNRYTNSILCSVLLMLVGISLRTFLTHTITIVWIVNLGAIILCFGGYISRIDRRVFAWCLLYITIGILSFVVNLRYFNSSLKSIGTNANIVVLPLFLMIIESINAETPFKEEQINKILYYVSSIGFVVIAISWITGYRDIVRVFLGQLSAYKANSCGFFYGKNIYGAFVSFSFCADLYLYKTTTNNKRKMFLSVCIKLLAVVLSFSRAALLQISIATFLFLWLNGKRSARDWVILGVVFSIFVLIMRFNPTVYRFFINNVIRFSTGDAGRATLRKLALSKVETGPLVYIFGVGYAGIDYFGLDIDNTYLYLYFSGGFTKILFFLLVIFVSFKRILLLRVRNFYLGNLCLAVEISYFFFAFFESIAVLELGLLNLMFTIFMFIIPSGYANAED